MVIPKQNVSQFALKIRPDLLICRPEVQSPSALQDR
jgi:hypothetical protein